MARKPQVQPVTLKDVPSNPTEATIDDVTLVRGVPGESLTAEQVERLQKSTGVKLDVGAEQDAPGDTLDGGGS